MNKEERINKVSAFRTILKIIAGGDTLFILFYFSGHAPALCVHSASLSEAVSVSAVSGA